MDGAAPGGDWHFPGSRAGGLGGSLPAGSNRSESQSINDDVLG